MIIEDAMIFYRDLFVHFFRNLLPRGKSRNRQSCMSMKNMLKKAQLEMLMIQRMCR
jgi:hypothetical protein